MTKLEQIELALLRNAVEGLTNQRDDYAAHLETMQYEMDAIPAIKAERDAYAAAADNMAASHKVERDALKDAARLALNALENIPTSFGNVAYTKTVQAAVAALKAVLK